MVLINMAAGNACRCFPSPLSLPATFWGSDPNANCRFHYNLRISLNWDNCFRFFRIFGAGCGIHGWREHVHKVEIANQPCDLPVLSIVNTLIPPDVSIVQILPEADKIVLIARPKNLVSYCPGCGYASRRVHSHYLRRFADLPWHGRVVEIHLHARRFRCDNLHGQRRIFTERLAETVQPRARRTVRLGESQREIGFATGGEPGSRLSRKLAMPVSGDTLLRMICLAAVEPFPPPRVVGIDDWAWRKGQRYGTIVCDLERNRVIDLLPDREAGTVAAWLKRYPGIEIVARDRAGSYADGASRGRTASPTSSGPLAFVAQSRRRIAENCGRPSA